jgi:hypothetical protein
MKAEPASHAAEGFEQDSDSMDSVDEIDKPSSMTAMLKRTDRERPVTLRSL